MEIEGEGALVEIVAERRSFSRVRGAIKRVRAKMAGESAMVAVARSKRTGADRVSNGRQRAPGAARADPAQTAAKLCS